jgi:mRNA interferase HigB
MVIISKTIINAFIANDAKAGDAFISWYIKAKVANWSNFSEMKKTFNSLDAVGNDLYVFNIKGNNYRLIALIFFNIRTIYIKFVGTHSQYDKIDFSDL